jgi:chemotaxis protein methyltransferase CheR
MSKLANDISITVTEMFRDPSFFYVLREKILPQLKSLPLIRIWDAGCSTGEEVYSLAILLHEVGLYDKTKIYATDISESALERAKEGEIPISHMQHYTKNYQQAGGNKEFSKYYSVKGNHAILQQYLKENIVFGQHNLATDQSFNEFHLIICRNVVIYFNQKLKERVFKLFFDSLSENSFLGLGSKESLFSCNTSSYFCVIDSSNNIYQKRV